MSLMCDKLLILIKSVADPTRLRMVALLAPGELTVGEISQVLGQSQPRISRHLKVLCEAGVLERYKEQHWVYYRLVRHGDGSVLRLHEWLDATDPVLDGDRRQRDLVIAERARRATDRLAERTVAIAPADTFGTTVRQVLLDELASLPVGDVLDVGTGAGSMLRALAPVAGRLVGIDRSADALRLARSELQRAGFGRCELRRGDMYRLAFADGEFDTVTLGSVLAHAEHPAAVLAEAFRVLRPGGRVVLVDDFDVLDAAATSPLAAMRSWVAGAGFACDRLRPIDTGTSHLLLAIARRPVRLMEAA